MVVTLDGIVMLVRLVVPWNVLPAMLMNPMLVGRVTKWPS